MSDAPEIKCVVWDLDGTVWDGVAVERLSDDELRPRDDVLAAMRTLAQRGVVNSLASRTDPAVADVVRRHGELAELLVGPEFGWGDKSEALRRIADGLGVALESLLLVDDSAFERAEVAHALPGVRTVDRAGLLVALADGELANGAVTADAAARTRRYQDEHAREAARESAASHEEFLRSCRLRLSVRDATATDAPRVAELSRRTHRLNSSGTLYDEPAARALVDDAAALCVVAELSDVFGDYGTVAACVVRRQADVATVELLTVSCRVAGRGAGAAFFAAVLQRLYDGGAARVVVPVQVTTANVEMRILLRQLGFSASGRSENGSASFERALDGLPAQVASWIEVSGG